MFEQKNAGNTPPACLISYPEDVNETLNQDDLYIPVTGVAMDDEKVAEVMLQIDDNEWVKVEVTPGDSVDWYYSLDVGELEPGEHVIRAQSFDERDSESPVAETTIYVHPGADDGSGDGGIKVNFNYLVGALILSLVVLGVAIIIRDVRKNYKPK